MTEQLQSNNEAVLIPRELSEGHLRLLEELWVNGPNYQTALEKKHGLPVRSTINVFLRQMDAWGLVVLDHEEKPNRRIPRKWFKITDRGKLWVMRDENTPSRSLLEKYKTLQLAGAFYRQDLGSIVRPIIRQVSELYRSPVVPGFLRDDYAALVFQQALLFATLGQQHEIVSKLMNEPEVWDLAESCLTMIRDFADGRLKYLEEVKSQARRSLD